MAPVNLVHARLNLYSKEKLQFFSKKSACLIGVSAVTLLNLVNKRLSYI